MTTLTRNATCPAPSRRRQISLTARFAVLRERRRLAGLSDEALHDIGLSRRAALREARRPFWDI